MPKTDCDPKVVLHSLPEYQTIGLVNGVRKWIGGIWAAIRDSARNVSEEGIRHVGPESYVAAGRYFGRRRPSRKCAS